MYYVSVEFNKRCHSTEKSDGSSEDDHDKQTVY